MTKLEFARKMLALSLTATGQGEAAAQANLQLGNGFYNLSYFGNGRRDLSGSVRDDFIPKWDDAGIAFQEYNYRDARYKVQNNAAPRAKSPAIDMDQAEQHYLAAARLSADRELKVKATFMAAKAEQNRRYARRESGNNEKPGAYFTTLRDSYSDTEYYREIIRECGYFRKFAEQ